MQAQNCKASVYPENICTGVCLQWLNSCTRDELIYMCTRTLKVKGKKRRGDTDLPLNLCLKIKKKKKEFCITFFCLLLDCGLVALKLKEFFIKVMTNPFQTCNLINEPMFKNTPKCVCLNLQ